jgi:eukaryotic-like serine/threonine-protein kinase
MYRRLSDRSIVEIKITRNRTTMNIGKTALLPGIMLLLLMVSCQKTQQSPAGKLSDVSAPWTIFRGNPELQGIASGSITDSLRPIWSYKTGDACIGSPVTDGHLVFIGSLDSNCYALELATGKPVWKFKGDEGFEASPLISNETVFIGDLDGTMHALNKKDGTQLWSFKTDNKIVGSANCITEKNMLIFGSHDDTLYCLDMQTGAVRWKYGSGSYINGTPATNGNIIVFGGCDANVHVLNADQGTAIGLIESGSYIAGSIALKDNNAFVGNYGKKLLKLDIQTQKILWEFASTGKQEPFFASPALVDTLVVASSRDGFVYCVSSQTGTLLWKFRAGKSVDSSPVICGKRVVVGSDDGFLYLLDLETGRSIQSYDVGGMITCSPLVSGRYVVVGDDNGVVSGFGDPSRS